MPTPSLLKDNRPYSRFPIVKTKVCMSSLSESDAVIQKAKDRKEISQKHLQIPSGVVRMHTFPRLNSIYTWQSPA